MRTYGRQYNEDGSYQWVEVATDEFGRNDYVYLLTLIQCLLLVRGESPFYANNGIPAQVSVLQQVFPDYYVALTQQQFAPYFSALTIAKLGGETPTYRINAILKQGARAEEYVPVPK